MKKLKAAITFSFFLLEPKAATEISVISQDTNFTDICQISSGELKKGTKKSSTISNEI